jgi:subfamily B ATP-binding cassette protein MsbA
MSPDSALRPLEAQVGKSLRLLIRLYPRWALPAVVLLGLLAFCIEGFGISLFVPLIQALQQSPNGGFEDGLLGHLLAPLARMDADDRLMLIGAFIFGSTVLKNLIGYGNAVLHAFLNSRITHALRTAIVRQLLALSHTYIDGTQSAELMNTLATETWRTADALSAFNALLISISAVTVFSVLLLAISWQLTLIVAVCTLLISLATRLATARAKSLGQEAVRANAGLATRMWELFGGMKVIRAFGREAYERDRFDAASRRVRDTFLRLDRLYALTQPIHEILSVLLLLGILLQAIIADRAALPRLVAFSMILFRLQPQARNIGSAWVALSAAAGSVGEVMGLLDTADKSYIRSGRVVLGRLEQGIRFEAVSFRYPAGETSALHEISLQIDAGRTTALVGPSGAGKTTLVNLICRFYDADDGTILVDGEPLRNLDLDDWRCHIGIVSQDIYMFGATVAENIAYGNARADRAAIVAAARLADADNFIRKLPQGYDTKIGDGGISLSGGQRQRLALARAIIRNPEILILDEATNSLDSLSDHVIRDALDHFGRDRTVIIIAHRLSTIERADRIIVLDHGRIAEMGDLETLVAEAGLFHRMYRLQQGEPLPAR